MNEIVFACAKASAARFYPCKKRKKAFSLVEMLMALLVASLLLAALAPVMTRKFTENVNVSGTGNAVTNKYCAFVNDEGSTLVFDEESACAVPDGVYSASAIIASGGGGGGGAAGIGESTTGAVNLVDTTTYVGSTAFNGATKSMTVAIAGPGGGGGGGSYYLKDAAIPKSQADCEPYGVWIPAAKNGGKDVCVSKYNPSDFQYPSSATNQWASPAIPTGPVQIDLGNGTKETVTVKGPYNTDGSQGSGQCAGANCCWKPSSTSYYSANSSYCDATSKDGNIKYGGCRRTVCQWKAAAAICANWKPLGANTTPGRLPTYAELTAWKNNGGVSDSGGKPGLMNWNPSSGSGLQLCNHSQSLTGAPRCFYLPGKCEGAGTGYVVLDYCYPHNVWSCTLQSSGSYYAADFVNGAWRPTGPCNTGHCQSTLAFSVRCVLEETRVFSPFSGGGGSSGTFVRVNVPQKVIARALEFGDGRIASNPGAASQGGAAGTASNVKGGNGNNGGVSKVAIYDAKNTLIWSLEVPGGNGGKGADAANTTDGAAATATSSPNCKYYDMTDPNYNATTTGHVVSCASLPNRVTFAAGKNGSGTTGGASAWLETNNAAGTGGAGGNGKTCDDGKPPVCTKGNNGSAGRIQVKHTPTYPGVGGGGGGAGNIIHVTNFSVNKGELIKVTVGHGGNGGNGVANGSGTNGQDGGASFITLKSGTTYGVYGGQGGRGGVKGNPSTNTKPIAGKGGVAQGLYDGTKVSSDHYFKGEAGQDAEPLPDSFEDLLQSPGGHGGINPKISGLTAGGTSNPIPCGGLNNKKNIKVNDDLTWEGASSCSGDSNKPFPLTREVFTNNFSSDVINNFVIGATGGGGGAWMQSASTPAESGAKGMGGYVYIYFGDWSSTGGGGS